MKEIESDKYKKIDDIVQIVKLVSVVFTGMVLIQCFFDKSNIYIEKDRVCHFYKHIQYSIVGISFLIVILLLIFVICSFATSNNIYTKKPTVMRRIETLVFVTMFTLVILASGGYGSEYKILFLFIITTTTIQSGMKYGIVVSIISSIIILSMDLLCAPKGIMNIYFEKDIVLSSIFILTSWPLGFYVKIETNHISDLKILANKDGLTGIYNHRYFHNVLNMEIDKAIQQKTKVSMIFIDIDYFKQYNDLHGHQKGDDALKKVGDILKETIRDDDIVARYGGEEFAIILPNTCEDEAVVIAENIHKNIENEYFYGQESQPNRNLTVSIGVSVFPDKSADDVELIKSADDALYRAKLFKNRVERYSSVLEELKNDMDKEEEKALASAKKLISLINAKDRYTYGHSERVVFYSRILAERLKLSKKEKMILIYSAYIHDIGKINVEKDILMKATPLTNEEWEILKNHPKGGVDIIKPIKELKDIEPIILHHHERYDGTGYPDGLKGQEIPYIARILTIVDSFDAMTSDRPYKKKRTYLQAIREIERCSGTQFDPYIAKVFISIIKENIDL